MRPPITSRRRAEEFDALVEGGSSLPAADRERYAELVSVVAELRAAPQPAPRPEFVSSLRERLMAEAETALVPTDPAGDSGPAPGRARRPERARRDRRVAVALGTAALVGATGSVAVASQGSLPGEVLYPVKRALESAQAGITQGDQDKGMLLLSKARLRLAEVADLAARDDARSRAGTAPTLDTFSDQAEEAADLLLAHHEATGSEGSIIALRDFTRSGMERLAELAPDLPTDAADELERAGRTLLDIDARTDQACPECGGEGIAEVPRFLAGPGAGPEAGGESEGGVTSVSETQEATSPAGPGEQPSTGPVLPPTGSVPSGGLGVPGQPQLPTAPLPPGGTPGPGEATGGGVVDGLKKTLVGKRTGGGEPTPADGGLVGGLGETLGTVTGSLLGESVGEGVTGTTESVREVLDGVLGVLPDGSSPPSAED